jgi:Family of unknown function (DUF5681)
MARNAQGRFEPGTCGNPRGRPPKLQRKINEQQLRKEFFEAGETLVQIVEDGKRKTVPARVAIEKQLALKAASGNMRAIIEWSKRAERHTLEYVKEQLGYLEQLIKSEDNIRQFPEDVTDEYKDLARLLRSTIDPDYLP